MGVFEWVAVVGAAAWVPHLAGLLYRLATKPKVTMIPVPEIEVGYTWLGPVVNIKASLFAERKDALVLDMRMTLRHEKGKQIALVWHSFVEKFSEMRDRSGEATEISRDQVATALRLSTAVPTEKLIRFQDPGFQEKNRRLTADADGTLNRLKGVNPSGAPEAFLTSPEHESLANQFKHDFPWEPGRYTVKLSVEILERKRPALAETSFELSTGDVERLRGNATLVVERIAKIAKVEKLEDVQYQWATPRLRGKDIMVRK